MIEQIKKNPIAIVSLSAALLFCILAVSSCVNSAGLKARLTKESSTRFDLEKEVNELKKNKLELEQRISGLTQELAEEKSAHQNTEKSLSQEQLINQSLKDELQKLTKLKEALEKDLKEALLSIGKPNVSAPKK